MLAIVETLTVFQIFLLQAFLTATLALISWGMRPKGKAPPRSTLDDIQIPTQDEGLPFGIVFGSPGRIKHAHVLYYGNLELRLIEYQDQPVGYEHLLTVHLGLCRSLDGVKRLWYRDRCVWPTLDDETAAAADGTALAHIEAYNSFGGWRGNGGIHGTVDIEYGGPTQLENEWLNQALSRFTGTVQDLSHGVLWTPPFTVTSSTFDDWADGSLIGGTYTCKGHTFAIVGHVGDTITINGWSVWWTTGEQYTVVPPAAARTPGPAYRGIVGLVFRHTYWGLNPVLGIISWEGKRTLHLTDGSDQWYVAKADIGAEHDLNPAHILRECLLDPTWGDHRAAGDLGDTWTAVADTLYTENFGLSFFYTPEPEALADFVELVLKHIDGYTWEDRTTGKLEIGLARADYVLGDLPLYDESDFTVIDWHEKTWYDVPGRVTVKYSNRLYPDNGKSVSYDDLAVQAKQGGDVREEVVELKGIFDDTLAARVVNRLGRQMCGLISVGTLRAKRTMSDLHRGSIVRFSSARLGVVQMVVRVGNLKLGPLGEDWVEIDVTSDVYAAAYLICGTPEPPIWQPPPIEADEFPTYTGTASAAGTVAGGGLGLGLVGEAAAAGTVEGTYTEPAAP